MIDACLVSAQKRRRLFWTNIPNVTQPQDRGILLKDIIETTVPINTSYRQIEPSMLKALQRGMCQLIAPNQKACTCTTAQRRWRNTGFIEDCYGLRYFTP